MASYKHIFVLGLLIAGCVFADETPVLQRTGMTFDPAIPTIKSVLGYDFGEQITRHSAMEKYLNALAAATPKVKLQQIGSTYEGRALYYVIVSSAENMARLEDIRQANLQLADPRAIPPSKAEAVIANNPLIVCLSYSVHGNEHSGVESALALIYYLAAATDSETQTLLKNLVVIIDPMQNPDGRERFINYFYANMSKTPNSDLNAAEHNETWPGGRTNHYLFDMNRDWIMMSQTETQARIAAYRQYQPHIMIDLHEMGENETYFFPPPTAPQNPNLPKSVAQWWGILGHAVADEFDKNKIDYYTQERFDFWFPGYGDSWPTYNGALSGTFEQGSVRGLVAKRRDGLVVNYQDAIWHHFLSSLAVCRMGATHRADKLRDFYEFRASAVQEGKTGAVKQYVLHRAFDPLETDRIVRLLLQHGIEVRQAQADFRTTVQNYMDDRSETKNFQKGDYIIAMDQPLKRLIQVVFERESQFDPSFLKEEERRRKEREPTELYDITAWSLPLAEGIEAYWSAEAPPAETSLVTQASSATRELLPSSYAYLLEYRSNDAIAAAWQLLERGVRVYFTTKPFTMNRSRYAAGSFIIRIKNNPENLAAILAEVSRATGVEFTAASTGWTEEGPDLGSGDVQFLETPKVALITNLPTDPNSFGAIDFLFDRRYNLDFTTVKTTDLPYAKFKDYNVLILPDSGYELDYKTVTGPQGITQLKSWVESGGTLIAVAGAANFLIADGTLTNVKKISRFIEDSAQAAPDASAEKKETETEKKTDPADTIPGSIARARLSKESFLSYGYSQDEIPVFVNSSNVFQPPSEMKTAVTYADAEHLKVGGLFWEITKKRLAGKAYATVEDLGSGHVILFAEDPSFRAAWEGLDKLLLNGVLFGPSL